MRWNSWKRWRLGHNAWAKGSRPKFSTNAHGKWFPLAFGFWFLLYPMPTGELFTVASTAGFELGDLIVLDREGAKIEKIVARKTATQLVLRPDTRFWRSVAWARAWAAQLKGALTARA